MNMDRYARQMILAEIGEAGQRRLTKARVLVIGAGGLGAPVLQYLAGAGIGHITIVDPDKSERSNLHRQPLFGETNLGQPKAQAARSILLNLNRDISIKAHVVALDPDNVEALTRDMDVVLDCADNFAVTYTLSDHCFDKNIPLISASVLSANGYVGGFCGGAPSVRAVFPDLPSSLESCATAGVMGPVVGLLGALQAQMCMTYLLALEPSPLGKLVSVDALKFSFGGFRFDNAPEPNEACYRFISPDAITPEDFVVELRGANEAAQPIISGAKRILITDFETVRPHPHPGAPRAVLVCHSGLRAWHAAHNLRSWWDGPVALVAAGHLTGDQT